MSFKNLKLFLKTTGFFVSLLIGSIILIGYVSQQIFPIVFYFFIFSWLYFAVSSFKFKKEEKFFIIFLMLFVVLSVVYFADNLRIYSNTNQELTKLEAQIDDLSSLESYASDYGDYYATEIKRSEDNSLILQANINNLKLKISEQPVYIEPEQPIILNDYGEDGKDDDD